MRKGYTPEGIITMKTMSISSKSLQTQPLLAAMKKVKVFMVFMIWGAMSGSGQRIGMMHTQDGSASKYFGQTYRALRGGTMSLGQSDGRTLIRVSYRYRSIPSNSFSYTGFRCARDAD